MRISLKSANTNSTVPTACHAKEFGLSFRSLVSTQLKDRDNSQNFGGSSSQQQSSSGTVESRETAKRCDRSFAQKPNQTKLSKHVCANLGATDRSVLLDRPKSLSGGQRSSRVNAASKAARTASREAAIGNSNAGNDASQSAPVEPLQSPAADAAGIGPTILGACGSDSRAEVTEPVADNRITDLNVAFEAANGSSASTTPNFASPSEAAQEPVISDQANVFDMVQSAEDGQSATFDQPTQEPNAQFAALMNPEFTNNADQDQTPPHVGGVGNGLDKPKGARNLNSIAHDGLIEQAVSELGTTPQPEAITSPRGTQMNGRSLPQQLSDDPHAKKVDPPGGNASTIPALPFAAHVSGGQGSVTEPPTNGPADAGKPLLTGAYTQQEEVNEGGWVGTQGMSTARLLQKMSESEMRVGMHSHEFGDISIRTSVSQQDMRAQISVDHSELGKAISAHLPSIQTKLGEEFGLHAKIEVTHTGNFLSGRQGETPGQNPSTASQSNLVSAPLSIAEADTAQVSPILATGDDGRLDIRA